MWKTIQIGLIASLLPLAIGSGAQNPKPLLALNIAPDRAVFRLGEGWDMNVELKNKGETPVLVYAECGPSALRLVFYGSGPLKEGLRWPWLCDIVPPPTADDFVRLNPGRSLKMHVELPADEIPRCPGVFEIHAEFGVPLDRHYISQFLSLPVDEVWTRESGKVISNSIRIELGKR